MALTGHTPPLRVENLNIFNNDIIYLGTFNASSGRTPKSGLATQDGSVIEYDSSGTIDGVAPSVSIVKASATITEARLNTKFEGNRYYVPQTSMFRRYQSDHTQSPL